MTDGVRGQGEPTDLSSHIVRPAIVASLDQLTAAGHRFSTIYADPPWPYSNGSARGAAARHYPLMPLEAIIAEPVPRLVRTRAHLHLWTTNSFLREAFSVIDAWGFSYKSCFVWAKPQLGTGNYWRVSHEFLLFATRGKLPFQDRSIRSWLVRPRTRHSRKPESVRALVERVSPGPYLDMYGREQICDPLWTVYGNQVARWLF